MERLALSVALLLALLLALNAISWWITRRARQQELDMVAGRLESRHVHAAGVRVHAWVSSARAAPTREREPVVLVPGAVVASGYMLPTAAELADDFEVHVPDPPGYGRSGKPRRYLDVRGLADALVAYMDAAGLERAHFLANSFGCQVVTELALRHPDRVARLVLQGPTVDARARSFWQELPRWLRQARLAPDGMKHITLRDYLRTGILRTVWTFRVALRDPIEERLPRVEAPTLVVRGEKDVLVPHEWARKVADRLPRGRLVELPDTPHTAVFAAPDALGRVVRPFLLDA